VLSPLPFALQAAQACVPHAELSLSLAGAFHEVDADAVDEAVEGLASALALPPGATPADELRALGVLLSGPLAPRCYEGDRVSGLMIDSALESGVAHPLMRAILAVEVGRRHGIDVGVVSNGDDHCVGHEWLEQPLLLRGDSGEVVDANDIPPTLQWRCSHETSGLLLDELEQRWLRWRRITEALRAADLRLRLPLEDDSLASARVRRAHVRSHLN
jgi:hypothetical protein